MPNQLPETDPGGGVQAIARGRLLVTGQMRSGTTMLASFLNSQPDIHLIPDALRVPAAAINAFGAGTDPAARLDEAAQSKLWRAMLNISLKNPATPAAEREVVESYRDRNEAPTFESLTELYLRLLDDIARKLPGFTFHGTKATRGEALAVNLAELGAKAIIILRDPRAVFVSQQARSKTDEKFGASDLELFVEEWRRSYDIWSGSSDAVLGLRYEDFVNRDDESVRISEYLSVEIDPHAKILSANSSFGDRSSGARRPGAVDRWRQAGDPDQFAFIEEMLKTEMERAGYV